MRDPCFAVLALLLCGALSGLSRAHAQAPDTASATGGTAAAQAAPPADSVRFPGPFEVVSRSAALADSAALALDEAAGLAGGGLSEAELRETAERVAELRSSLARLETEAWLAPERLSQLHDQALAQQDRLDALVEALSDRLERIGALRDGWARRRAFWLEWSAELGGTPEYALLAPDVQDALAQAAEVQRELATAATGMLARRRALAALQEGAREVVEASSDLRSRRREALFGRSAPPLFSPEFWGTLDARSEPVPGGSLAAWIAAHGRVLALHLFLVAALGWLIGRLRGTAGPWTRFARRPWPTAVLLGTSLVSSGYAAAPLANVAIWALLGVSGAVLARGGIRDPGARRAVYVVAGLFPLFLVAEAAPVPEGWVRLALATFAAAGAGLLGVAAYARGGTRSRAAVWALGLSAAGAALVLAAELFGYDLFARWAVRSTMVSAVAIFTLVLVVLLARGGLQRLLRRDPSSRFRFVRRVARPLAERLAWLLQAVLMIGTALYLLDVWEVITSPLQTWEALLAVGFSVGSVEITAERVILAALVLYLAFLLSWTLRAFLQDEALPRQMDAGVLNAVTTLSHYALVVVGAIVALGVIGFQLENFALIAGALGVGIGFGLQNVVNNFVSGLILLFERPVRVGDTVVVGGEWGVIGRIGLRSTVMLTLDQSEMIVPNADLISEKVTNWTLSSSVARLVVPVGVAYGSELRTIFEILSAVSADHPRVLDEPPPQPLFVGFGDSSLDFELRVWVLGVVDRLVVRSELLTEIDARFRVAGVEVPFPQRDLHLRSALPGFLVEPRPTDGTPDCLKESPE